MVLSLSHDIAVGAISVAPVSDREFIGTGSLGTFSGQGNLLVVLGLAHDIAVGATSVAPVSDR